MAFAGDGAVLGAVLAYVAVRSLMKFAAASSSLRKIRDAPFVQVSDLRCLLDGGDGGERLVVVRGAVELKWAVTRSWKNLWPDVLVSRDSRVCAIVIKRSQKYVYNKWRGFFGWYHDMRKVLARAWREQGTTSFRTVPFVLVDDCQQLQYDYAVVDLDGSKHSLPLTTVYHQPIPASPYAFLQAFFGQEYLVVLDEEKILPVGKDITAVGICSSENGVPEIKSCRGLPYFLSELTKDQMVAELSFRTKILLWSGIVVGSMSIGLLGYAILRNWNKWKEWQAQRRVQQENCAAAAAAAADTSSSAEFEAVEDEEEVRDIPDGQLCVICLRRRRRSAFVPCGHLVCCQLCSLSVERNLAPKCPVCRQKIRSSVRIYDS